MAEAVSRTITVLFTDLVGSTELASQLSPSAADELRRTHLGLLERSATATQGHVVKNLGDGLMVTYESAAQAVAGAIAMQRAIRRHNRRRAATPLAIRVGLNLGEALREDDDWFGTPVVLAARLCAAADGGQILTTDMVRALLESRDEYRFKTLGVRELKGFTDLVPVCAVEWEDVSELSGELPSGLAEVGRRGSFVGRRAELSQLHEAFDRVRSGERRLVLVAGEPGIGKSRLVSELAVAGHAAGATVLFGRCYEETLTPYQPFVEALGQLGHELSRLVPDTAAGPTGNPVFVLQPGAESERYLLFEAVSSVLAELAQESPVVLVLDDLHWADRPTLSLLQYLARSPEPIPILLLGTYRETDLSRDHPLAEVLADLRRERLYERIVLRGLDENELAELIADRAGHEPPAAFTAAVYAETEGNPFFTEEVLLHLAETGVIYQRDGRWVSNVTAIEQLGIPEGIREVIGRRLSRLSEQANRFLGVAAVLGREFSLRAAGGVSGLGEDEVLDAVDEAAVARLVVEYPADPDRYTFAHALIRQTLYDELSGARRLRLHQKSGEVLERLYADDIGPHLGELAHHFSQLAYGGDVDIAVQYCIRAAEWAQNLLAFEEAADHYRRALQVLEIAERPPDEQQCDLQTSLAETLQNLDGFLTVRAAVQRAIELARALDDRSRFVRAVAGLPLSPDTAFDDRALVEEAISRLHPEERAPRAALLHRLAYAYGFSSDVGEDRRDAMTRQAVDAAREVGDPNGVIRALHTERMYLQHSPDMARRAAVVNELCELAARHPTPRVLHIAINARVADDFIAGDVASVRDEIATMKSGDSGLPSVTVTWYTLVLEAALALLEGRFADAEELATKAYTAGRNDSGSIAISTYGLQLFALRRDQGRLAEMEPNLKQLVDRVKGQPFQGPAIHAGLAYLYAEEGRLDDAHRELDDIVTNGQYRRLEAGTITLAHLGEVAAAVGDRNLLDELYRRLVPYDGQTIIVIPSTYCNGAVARYLGLFASGLGLYDEAEQHFHDALAMNERMNAQPWIARTQIDYARMLLTRGNPADRDQATQLRDAGLQTARELGMPTVVARATPLLG